MSSADFRDRIKGIVLQQEGPREPSPIVRTPEDHGYYPPKHCAPCAGTGFVISMGIREECGLCDDSEEQSREGAV